MTYTSMLPVFFLLAACAEMQDGTGVTTPASAGATVFDDKDRADYRPGGDLVLPTGGGLNDEED